MIMNAVVIEVEWVRMLVLDLESRQRVIVNTPDAYLFRPGEVVRIRYNGVMTRSIPPQITAISITTVPTDGFPPRPPVRPPVIFPPIVLPPIIRPPVIRPPVIRPPVVRPPVVRPPSGRPPSGGPPPGRPPSGRPPSGGPPPGRPPSGPRPRNY